MVADTGGTEAIEAADGLAGKPARRPNIFIILFDTLRADHTEPYGAKNIKTPSMLRLASRGVTFDAAFVVLHDSLWKE